jgi:anti-anti-sigma regulatory factor
LSGAFIALLSNVTLKIEKVVVDHRASIKLIGRIRAEHLPELKEQIAAGAPSVALDLEEVTLVDSDVVRFLGARESEGVQLVNCSAYIRAWIVREQETSTKE